MNGTNFIKQGLYIQGLPIYDADIPYIQNILHTINKAQVSTEAFPGLNLEVPIMIFDKGVMQ